MKNRNCSLIPTNQEVQNIKPVASVPREKINCSPPLNQGPIRSGGSEKIIITCYENEVPSFVAAEMDLLYEHINSSLTHFGVIRQAIGASTYVVRDEDRTIVILLFKRNKNIVSVINEMIKIEEDEILRFSNYIFSTYQTVSKISFSFIQKNILRLPFPFQQLVWSEDIVLTLPLSQEAYLASLGKNMRRNIRRYTDRLTCDFPSYHYQVYQGEEICEQHIRNLLDLSKARITEKNTPFIIGQEEADWIVRATKKCGLVGVATINGTTCGGAISYRVGKNYFMHTIAHDSKYNGYSLGTLCYYNTICESILRGGKEFHFLWGKYEYKYRLLGVDRYMASLAIYRSYKSYLYDIDLLIINVIKNYIRHVKLQTLEMEHKDSFTAKLMTRLIKFLRKIKRRKS
jgi:hypothetical protein